MRTVKHDKTGNIYLAIQVVTNATNSKDGESMMLYMNLEGMHFVRDIKEFWEKFTPIQSSSVVGLEI